MVDIDLETVINFCDKFEKEYLEILHINTSDIPSGINRSSFQMLRSAYWKRRAQTLRKEMRK